MNSEFTTCPVCDMKLPPKTAEAQMNYQGQTYYFCYSSCQVLFSWNPEQYIHPAEQVLPATKSVR